MTLVVSALSVKEPHAPSYPGIWTMVTATVCWQLGHCCVSAPLHASSVMREQCCVIPSTQQRALAARVHTHRPALLNLVT